MKPVDPRALVHYLAACKVAGVAAAETRVTDLRALIERCGGLSIPEATKLLRKTVTNTIEPNGPVRLVKVK